MTPLENLDALLVRVIADRERAIVTAFDPDMPRPYRREVDAFDLNEQIDHLLDSINRIALGVADARPAPKSERPTP